MNSIFKGIFLLCILVTFLGWSRITFSETISVLNWNVNAGSVESIAARKGGIEKLAMEVTPDILVLQEINSFAAAELLAKYLGMKKPYIAVSNFGRDDKVIYAGLEVAVASRFPIKSILEYQNQWSDNGDAISDTKPPFLVQPNGEVKVLGAKSMSALVVPGDVITDLEKRKLHVSRGLLRVELGNGIVVYPVHLKSNRTRLCGVLRDIDDMFWTLDKTSTAIPSTSDRVDDIETAIKWLVRSKVNGKDNAESIKSVKFQRNSAEFIESHRVVAIQRENGAAAAARLVAEDLKLGHIQAVLVAGDFNTPLKENSKTGVNLDEDFCMPEKLDCGTKKVADTCGDMDGHDDTHFILQGGIVDGLKMKPLFDKEEPTYISTGYAKSPIDNIYVAGKRANEFKEARLLKGSGEVAFGSDHFPILTQIDW